MSKINTFLEEATERCSEEITEFLVPVLTTLRHMDLHDRGRIMEDFRTISHDASCSAADPGLVEGPVTTPGEVESKNLEGAGRETGTLPKDETTETLPKDVDEISFGRALWANMDDVARLAKRLEYARVQISEIHERLVMEVDGAWAGVCAGVGWGLVIVDHLDWLLVREDRGRKDEDEQNPLEQPEKFFRRSVLTRLACCLETELSGSGAEDFLGKGDILADEREQLCNMIQKPTSPDGTPPQGALPPGALHDHATRVNEERLRLLLSSNAAVLDFCASPQIHQIVRRIHTTLELDVDEKFGTLKTDDLLRQECLLLRQECVILTQTTSPSRKAPAPHLRADVALALQNARERLCRLYGPCLEIYLVLQDLLKKLDRLGEVCARSERCLTDAYRILLSRGTSPGAAAARVDNSKSPSGDQHAGGGRHDQQPFPRRVLGLKPKEMFSDSEKSILGRCYRRVFEQKAWESHLRAVDVCLEIGGGVLPSAFVTLRGVGQGGGHDVSGAGQGGGVPRPCPSGIQQMEPHGEEAQEDQQEKVNEDVERERHFEDEVQANGFGDDRRRDVQEKVVVVAAEECQRAEPRSETNSRESVQNEQESIQPRMEEGDHNTPPPPPPPVAGTNPSSEQLRPILFGMVAQALHPDLYNSFSAAAFSLRFLSPALPNFPWTWAAESVLEVFFRSAFQMVKFCFDFLLVVSSLMALNRFLELPSLAHISFNLKHTALVDALQKLPVLSIV